LVWVVLILLLGGGLLGMGGLFWYRTARLLNFFFETELDPEKGFKVSMVGVVMFLAGFALLYFGFGRAG
jgi:hypothetical protein